MTDDEHAEAVKAAELEYAAAIQGSANARTEIEKLLAFNALVAAWRKIHPNEAESDDGSGFSIT